MFARLDALQVVDLITARIDHNAAGCANNNHPAITGVDFHPVAALVVPGNQLVIVFEACIKRVIELPVVLELVPSAGGRHAVRKIHPQRPAAHVDLMGTVIERLTRAPRFKPMPVVRLDVVLVRLTRSRPLPEIPIEGGGNRPGLPVPMDWRVLLYQALA